MPNPIASGEVLRNVERPIALSALLSNRVRSMVDDTIAGPDVHTRVADFAFGNLNNLLRDGTFSLNETLINGIQGGPSEFTVPAKIEFRLTEAARLQEAVAFAMAFLAAESPDPGGAFSRAWFVTVDGVTTLDYDAISDKATVTIANFAPYARRLEQGWHKRGTAHHRPGLFLTEAARQAVQGKFPRLTVERVFVPLSYVPMTSTETSWEVPYVKKRGSDAGEEILYPAIQISAA